MKCPKCKSAKLRLDEDRRSKSARRYCPLCSYSEWLVLDGGRVNNG